MDRIYWFIRNCSCGLFAIILILLGCVRRARKRALSGAVITSLYFHKPTPSLLRRCILWLMKHGFTFISLDDVRDVLYCGKPFPKGAVWISFDDGWREQIDVLPLIRQYKIPVTLFIPSGIVNDKGLYPWLHDTTHPSFNSRAASRLHAARQKRSRESLSVAELMQIVSCQWVTVGTHTVSHPVLPYCTDEKVGFEIGDCKQVVERWTGKTVKYFSYPEGRLDGRERQFLNKFGYELAVTTTSAFITGKTDPFLVPRFSVADDIFFPEAICNMVGVWRRPADRLKTLLKVWRKTP